MKEEEKVFQKEIGKIPLEQTGVLLKYARRLKKIQKPEVHCRIAVLGSCSIQHLVQAMEVLLYRDGICAKIYEGNYDGIMADVLDADSAFYRFHPDITVLLPDYRDIWQFPEMFDPQVQVESCVSRIAEEQVRIWEAVHRGLPNCQVIMGNYVVPVERVLGNLEGNYAFSHQSIYRRLNERLVDVHPGYVLLADLEYLASIHGKLDWLDTSAYMLSKAPFALKYTGYVADLFVKLTGAYLGRVRKCIVLDLDNTLWGGIVSEEGAEGIRIGPDDAVGEAFSFFQGYLKQLKERGILLAVSSKNEEAVAKEPFEKNPYMVLKLEDFAAFYANWDDKAENIKRIAEEIGIGLDSIVFFDDNPAERDLVEMQLPEVTVINVPEEPANYARALELSGSFQWAALTPEDGARAATYAADRKREDLLGRAGDYDAYLRQLQMHGSVGTVDGGMVQRFAQLINKSNQFNLRTKRYTEAELSGMMEREDYRLLAGSLADKFSRYGIVSCVILKKDGDRCFIDTWVMSCRVLKRGMEYLMFRHILQAVREWGCTVVSGEFLPTEKNGMVRGLLPELGFLPDIGWNDGGGTKYKYDLGKEFTKEYFIVEDMT